MPFVPTPSGINIDRGNGWRRTRKRIRREIDGIAGDDDSYALAMSYSLAKAKLERVERLKALSKVKPGPPKKGRTKKRTPISTNRDLYISLRDCSRDRHCNSLACPICARYIKARMVDQFLRTVRARPEDMRFGTLYIHTKRHALIQPSRLTIRSPAPTSADVRALRASLDEMLRGIELPRPFMGIIEIAAGHAKGKGWRFFPHLHFVTVDDGLTPLRDRFQGKARHSPDYTADGERYARQLQIKPMGENPARTLAYMLKFSTAHKPLTARAAGIKAQGVRPSNKKVERAHLRWLHNSRLDEVLVLHGLRRHGSMLRWKGLG